MAGLVQRRGVAQACGCQHAQRTRDLGGLVGQDVAKHVLGDHHVEVGRAADQLHGRVVHQQVLDFHIGVFLLADAVHNLAPHAAGFKHVGLIDAGHLVATLARSLERLAGDALNLVLTILKRIVGALALRSVGAGALLVVEALTFAEVQASGELAHDHKVDALDDLGLKRGGACERIEDLHGTQVGVQTQALADTQKARLGARRAGIGGVPLRPAHGRKQHGIGGLCGFERSCRQRVAHRVDGGAADKRIGAGELHVVLLAHRFKNLHAFGNDFRADAVARQRANVVLRHRKPSFTDRVGKRTCGTSNCPAQRQANCGAR